MANTYTANYNLIKPEVGADTNAWGAHLNQNLDTIDTKLKDLEGAGAGGGAGYLPLAGGTMSGFITLHAAPTSASHAATKAYVDSAVSGGTSGAYLPTTGGTLNGNLTVNGTVSTSGALSVGLAGTWNASTGAIATIGNISTSTGSISAFGNILSTAGSVGTAGGGITSGGAFSGTSLTVGSGSVTCGALTTSGNETFSGSAHAFNNCSSRSTISGMLVKSSSSNVFLNFVSGSSSAGVIYGSTSSVGFSGESGTPYAALSLSSGTWITSSDARLKENIRTIDNALATVKNLRGVFYTMSGKQQEALGVIAQEIMPYLPQAVSANDDGYYSVSYGNIVGLLINAIKELEARVAQLEAK